MGWWFVGDSLFLFVCFNFSSGFEWQVRRIMFTDSIQIFNRKFFISFTIPTQFRMRLVQKQLSSSTHVQHWVTGQENDHSETIKNWSSHRTTYSLVNLYLSMRLFNIYLILHIFNFMYLCDLLYIYKTNDDY